MKLLNKNKNKLTIDTQAHERATNLERISKIKILPVVIAASIALLAGIFFSYYYGQNLDISRQKVSYIASLKQMSERIEKSALQARTGSSNAFSELKSSEKLIDSLLLVLQDGGKVIETDTKINKINAHFAPQFNSVVQEWTQNKPLLDALILQEYNIVSLKNDVMRERTNIQSLMDLSSSFQKSMQNNQVNNNNKYAQELTLLINRINQGTNELFSSESFSLETGYILVKDLRQYSLILTMYRDGSQVYSIDKISDQNSFNILNQMYREFQPFDKLSEEIFTQVATLNNAKDVALQVSNSSRNLLKTATELDNAFADEINSLNLYKYLSIGSFLLSAIIIILMAIVFFEKFKEATQIAKELENTQNNQKAVDLLLEQINPMGNGDFTRRVYVSDKFVKQIAEKVDKTRELLGGIVRKIINTSEAIVKNADNTDETSKRLLEVSNIQFIQMESSIEKLGHITSEMDEVAQTTWMAQEESNQSKLASQEGEKLVSQSMAKMDEIRNNIQESSKKIKKSSESAQAITEVTALIQNITKQIEVLALNAAIQAASSGDAGREFTVVAQEVQRLAFDSKEATQQILELVKEVQEDIGVAVSSMEKTTQEVVEGARLTDNAGKALKLIEQLSSQVAQRVQDASTKLEEKSSDMTKISLEMKDLQNTTERSKDIVKITAMQVESLKKISQELTDTVHGYKVEK